MEQFLQLRKNRKAFQFFCEKFLSVVVGKNKWKDGRLFHHKVSKVATVSDEAMALLHLENNFDRWQRAVDMM
jgi:hypothetical protein